LNVCNCRTALQHTATYCNTLQHPTTHCNTLQRTATSCNTLQHNAYLPLCNECVVAHKLAHLTATRCNTLPHPATPCNTLQHPATPCNTLRVCAPQRERHRSQTRPRTPTRAHLNAFRALLRVSTCRAATSASSLTNSPANSTTTMHPNVACTPTRALATAYLASKIHRRWPREGTPSSMMRSATIVSALAPTLPNHRHSPHFVVHVP